MHIYNFQTKTNFFIFILGQTNYPSSNFLLRIGFSLCNKTDPHLKGHTTQ